MYGGIGDGLAGGFSGGFGGFGVSEGSAWGSGLVLASCGGLVGGWIVEGSLGIGVFCDDAGEDGIFEEKPSSEFPNVELNGSGEDGSGGLGSSNGPIQPSCRPRTYSFHVCLPSIRSPWMPSQALIWAPLRKSSSRSSTLSSNASFDSSPLRLLIRRILDARLARTSPSRRPSTTSQSSAPATSIGLTYS